jgi:hypothetical protein
MAQSDGEFPPPIPAASPPSRTGSRVVVWGVVALLWLGGISGGMWALWAYSAAPGQAAGATDNWPAEVSFPRAPGQATLVMLLHPHCPCSRASVHQLAEIMARSGQTVRAYALFVRPEGCPPGWERGDLWDTAAAIPGVTPLCDQAGADARRFGAFTSGQVLLYNANGQCRFSGGITAARGEADRDDPGVERIVAFLQGGVAPPAESLPVYGCPLHDPQKVLVKGVVECLK